MAMVNYKKNNIFNISTLFQEKKFGTIHLFTRENIIGGKKMELVPIYGRMDQNIKVNGIKIIQKVMVFAIFLIINYIMENGKIIK